MNTESMNIRKFYKKMLPGRKTVKSLFVYNATSSRLARDLPLKSSDTIITIVDLYIRSNKPLVSVTLVSPSGKKYKMIQNANNNIHYTTNFGTSMERVVDNSARDDWHVIIKVRWFTFYMIDRVTFTEIPPVPKKPTIPKKVFKIYLSFAQNIAADDQLVYKRAAKIWENIICCTSQKEHRSVDIAVTQERIDGSGGTLGQAGPSALHGKSNLPIRGKMAFDISDIMYMRSKGTLQDVILHEMGHVLGIGTLWKYYGLVSGSGTVNPVYIGIAVLDKYRELVGDDTVKGVPLANNGQPGTSEAHFRENVFGTELMTGYIAGAENELSPLSAAALSDLGYIVDYDSVYVENYTIPSSFKIASIGLMGANPPSTYHHQYCTTCGGADNLPLEFPGKSD